MGEPKLTEAQMETLRVIASGEQDDCTVMLPAGLIQLDKEQFPPRIVLTDRGREMLTDA